LGQTQKSGGVKPGPDLCMVLSQNHSVQVCSDERFGLN